MQEKYVPPAADFSALRRHMEGGIEAAAAAAVARPVETMLFGRKDKRIQDSVQKAEKRIQDGIKKAQSEAERKKFGARPVAQVQARQTHEDDWSDYGWIEFEGAWVDDTGNSVIVGNADVWSMSYTAKVSRHPRPDAVLEIRMALDGNWYCGNSYLNQRTSSKNELHWVRHDGRCSKWLRGRIAPSVQRRPEELMGAWVDPHGNFVQVYSTDAWSADLMAALSRPGRQDTHLPLMPAPDGRWICGHSTLDLSESTASELYWVRGDGHVSKWMRGRK